MTHALAYASDIPNDASDSKLPDRVVFYRDMTRALIEERETFPGWQKNSPARLRNIPYGHDDGMAGNHHSSHNGPLLLRPLPLPGDLPRVQARYAGQIPLRQLVPGKPFDEYGFISEDQLDFAAPETYIRWVQPIESELDKQASSSGIVMLTDILTKQQVPGPQVEYDMDSLDTEWLELYNTERSKRGEEPVPAEVFEIIMDRLEKEWFDLVCLVWLWIRTNCPEANDHPSGHRTRVSQKLSTKLQTVSARFVMTARPSSPTPSSFATGATSPSTRTATASPISQPTSGYVASAPSPLTNQSPASSVPTKEAHSSRPPRALTGHIFSAHCSFPKSASATASIWNPSMALN